MKRAQRAPVGGAHEDGTGEAYPSVRPGQSVPALQGRVKRFLGFEAKVGAGSEWRAKIRWTPLALLLGSLGSAPAADLPELTLPQGVGVNVHFVRGHEQDLDRIAAAGFKFIRMDFGWGAIERRRGEYSWAEYEELTANLEKRGLRAIYILDYSNELYEPEGSPRHPESVAAFARWAGAAASHFKGRRIIWEIWNEPNIDFWKPKPDADQYVALARAACQAVRSNDSRATLIAPASSEFPWAFLESLFQAGLLEQLDAVSVHPYRDYRRPPESVYPDYLKLRALIERYASPARKTLPIISGEWGYSTHLHGVSLPIQAAFLARQQLANLWHGVPLSIWYDWKNDGDDPAENEHNFGTVYPDLRPKPAYEALQVMTRELSGYRVAQRLEAGRAENFVLLLLNPAGGQKLAAWSLSDPQPGAVDIGLASAGDLAIVDGCGQPKMVELQGTRLQLALAPLPQYITLKKPSRTLTATGAWKVTPPLPIQAGVKNNLDIRLTVTNPFPESVTAFARLAGPKLSDRKRVKLARGKTATLSLSATVSRRDLPTVPVELTLELQDAGGNLIGKRTESLPCALANSLRLALAPMERGLLVTVQNKSAGAFEGCLTSGNERRPVSLNASTASIRAEFSRPNSESSFVPPQYRLLDDQGRLAAETAAGRFDRIEVGNFSARLDGDDKIPATSSIRQALAPENGSPYAKVFALDYQFDLGWRFVRCEPQNQVRFGSRPAALGLWVYSDKSGNALRIRVRDAAGQTFQPSGPNLDWSGWRWVTFDLQDLASAGHWGGADDGVARGDLTLDTPLLLDSGKRKTAGRIYFVGLTAIY